MVTYGEEILKETLMEQIPYVARYGTVTDNTA